MPITTQKINNIEAKSSESQTQDEFKKPKKYGWSSNWMAW